MLINIDYSKSLIDIIFELLNYTFGELSFGHNRTYFSSHLSSIACCKRSACLQTLAIQKTDKIHL